MKIVIPNSLKQYNDMILSTTLTTQFSVPPHDTTSFFYQGNMCAFAGRLYRSTEFNTNKAPDIYPEFWYDWGVWDNVTEQVWATTTTYAVGDLVTYKSAYSYAIYKCATASTGEIPITTPASWLKIGEVNVNRSLIGATENKTEQVGGFSMSLNANKADYIYLLGISANDVTIEVKDSAGTAIKTVSETLTYKGAASWSDYYFKDFTYRKTFGTEIPMGFNNSITLTINSSSIARLGNIVIGRSFYIGEVLWGAGAGILDFSSKQRDATFGDIDLKQGSFADRADIVAIVDTNRADAVKNFLTTIRGKEVLFLADENTTGFDMLKIRGFIRDFAVTLSNNKTTEISIQIEGLI